MAKVINRKIFLEELPTDKNNKICWKESIGYVVKFVYDDIEGELEILDFNKKKLTLKYKDLIVDNIHVEVFKQCGIGKLLNKRTSNFKIEIGTNFNDANRDITITNMKYREDTSGKNWKCYQYKCNKCGFDCGEHFKNGYLKGICYVTEGSLLNGVGCACCCMYSQVVVPEINSIWATDRWMIDLGVSEADAKRYSRGSKNKITVRCSDCGKNKNIVIGSIYKHKSIQCTCGDGKSYPEKFIMGLLDQLKIDYETEYTPNWSNRKRYDFHIGLNNSIIETHGSQHPGTKYHDNKGFSRCSKDTRTPKEESENDIYKEQLAKENGIENYIVIDCSKSDMEFIKNEILNSKLAELYDLSSVDWLECEEFALKNMAKEVCDYWNHKEEWETTKDISDKLNLGRNLVINFLKKGTKLNWCDYNPKYEMIKSNTNNAKENGKNLSKKVEVFKNGNSLGVFSSGLSLDKQSLDVFGVKLDFRNISAVCNGKRKTYKGYTFKFV